MLLRISAKSVLLGAVSAVALMSAAHAADVVQEQAAPGFNWSGVYVGFGVGAGANVHELSGDILPGVSLNGIGGEGIFGQATVGYDYMVSQRFLLGGLIDAHVGTIKTSLDIVPLGGLSADVKETYGFDVGVRAGYLLTPTTLGYVLGGYAWQKYKLDTNAGFGMDWDQGGYFVGAGLETAINSNWTLKGEYRYTRFSTTDDLLSQFGAPDGTLNLDTSRHTFEVAASYRFNANDGAAASFETPSYNWTGFYVGGGLGAGASVHSIDSDPLGVNFNGLGGEGVLGEASIGYDQDMGSWVAGILVDARYSGMTTKLEVPGGQINLDTDYGFDVLGRVGMKVNDSTLAYALAGYSWQHFDLNASSPIGDILDWGSSGFSVGAGLETAVSDKVTVGLEYRYSQFAKKDFSSDLGAPISDFLTSTPSFHTVRIDAKYKFN